LTGSDRTLVVDTD
ncbi:unnamed protein product, partial [Allacma fusca]